MDIAPAAIGPCNRTSSLPIVAAVWSALTVVPMAIMAITSGDLFGLVVFPFIVWGPALGIAVLGYALRRQE